MSTEPTARTFLVAGTAVAARPLAPALYVVATPIGNLGDITLRALETLAAADVVACEDTRVSRVLLDRYGIRQHTVAYHEHNATEAGPRLLAAVREGRSVALISDAGTPLVSDPGFRLVEAMLEAGLRVVPLPGPSAVVTALSAAGLPTDTFLFAGFLPQKTAARRGRLAALRTIPASLVFYESPHRLAASLSDMAGELGGERAAVVARELTKTFEEFRRAPLAELAGHYEEADAPKGEIVVCVAPPAEAAPEAGDIDRMLLALAAEMPVSKAAGEAARMTGRPKQELYRRILELRATGDDA